MLTRDFVKAVADKAKLPADAVRAVLEAMQGVAVGQLLATGEVRVPGIVSLRRIDRKPRMARNPRTGEAAPVEAGMTLKARPVKAMVDGAVKELRGAAVAA